MIRPYPALYRTAKILHAQRAIQIGVQNSVPAFLRNINGRSTLGIPRS